MPLTGGSGRTSRSSIPGYAHGDAPRSPRRRDQPAGRRTARPAGTLVAGARWRAQPRHWCCSATSTTRPAAAVLHPSRRVGHRGLLRPGVFGACGWWPAVRSMVAGWRGRSRSPPWPCRCCCRTNPAGRHRSPGGQAVFRGSLRCRAHAAGRDRPVCVVLLGGRARRGLRWQHIVRSRAVARRRADAVSTGCSPNPKRILLAASAYVAIGLVLDAH